jgi:hypothetical protein
LIGTGRKPGIAAPAAPPPGDHHPLAGCDQIGYHLARFRVAYDGPWRHIDQQISTTAPGLVAGATGRAALCPEVGLVAEVDQGIQGRLDDQDHVATLAAITAAGTTARYVFFAAKVDDSVATIAAPDMYFRFVVTHSWRSLARVKGSVKPRLADGS